MLDLKNTLNEDCISDMTASIANGSITSEALVRACFERIREREMVVGAWTHLDEEMALTGTGLR